VKQVQINQLNITRRGTRNITKMKTRNYEELVNKTQAVMGITEVQNNLKTSFVTKAFDHYISN